MHGGSRRDLLVHGAFHTLGNHVACQICGHGAGQRIIGIVLMPDGIGGVGLLQLDDIVIGEAVVLVAVAHAGAVNTVAGPDLQLIAALKAVLGQILEVRIGLLIKRRTFHVIAHAVRTGEFHPGAVGVQVFHILLAVDNAEQAHIEAVVADSGNLRLRPLDLDAQLAAGFLHIQEAINPGVSFNILIQLLRCHGVDSIEGPLRFGQPIRMVRKEIRQIFIIDTFLMVEVVQQIVCNGSLSRVTILLQIIIDPAHHVEGHLCAAGNAEDILIEVIRNHGAGKMDGQILAVIGENRQRAAILQIADVGSISRCQHEAVVPIAIVIPGFILNQDLELIVIARHLAIVFPHGQGALRQINHQIFARSFMDRIIELVNTAVFLVSIIGNGLRLLLGVIHRAGLFRDLRRVLVLCNLNCPGFLLTYMHGVT